MFKVGELIGWCRSTKKEKDLWIQWDGEVGIVLEVYDENEFLVKWRKNNGSLSPCAVEIVDEEDSFRTIKEILATKPEKE